MHVQAIVIHRYGGPDTLTYEELPDPAPGPDGHLIEVRAAASTRSTGDPGGYHETSRDGLVRGKLVLEV